MIKPAPVPAGASGRVLLIDDDESMCETLALCLVRRGFAVRWRTSALDALALLHDEEFDVIYSDLNMDGMSGLELCERAVVLRPGLPFIIVTGLGAPDVKAAALRAGAYEFMTKPVELEALRLALLRAVSFGVAARLKGLTR